MVEPHANFATGWGLRWTSLWGHEPCEGCAEMSGEPHANFATEAFGGAPYGPRTMRWVFRNGRGTACELC
eukprot:3651653-Pyramimonas_sp.AAC.1